jgi:hypothetical protein
MHLIRTPGSGHSQQNELDSMPRDSTHSNQPNDDDPHDAA